MLLGISGVFSQEKDSTIVTAHHVGRLQMETGVFRSIAWGDNFLHDAYKLETGVEVGIDVYLSPNWLIGLRMDILDTEIEKPEKLGNFKSTYISTLGVIGGYVYSFSKSMDLSILAGLGFARYAHRSNFGTNFHDDAFALWLEPKLGYRITNNIGIFGKVKLRNDFLRIETSPDLNDYFNNASYLSFGLGIRITTN